MIRKSTASTRLAKPLHAIHITSLVAWASALVLAGCVTTSGPTFLGGESKGKAAPNASETNNPAGTGASEANGAANQLIDDVLSAARKVTWEKKNFSNYSFVHDNSTGLLWATGIRERRSFQEAKHWINNLSIDELAGWRMPTHAEFLGSRLFPSRAPCNVAPSNTSYGNEIYNGPGWTSTMLDQHQAYLISYSVGGACHRHEDWSSHIDKESRYWQINYAVRNEDELSRIITQPRASAEAQLVAVAKILLRSKLEYKKPDLTPPSEPARIQPRALTKGEFETSADFGARQKQEQARAEAENKRALAAHEQVLREFKTRVDADRQKESAWHEALKTPETRRRLAEQALSEAFNIVFGSPTLRDVRYNADKSAFDAVLSGSRESLLAGKQGQEVTNGESRKKSSSQMIPTSKAAPLAAQAWRMALLIPSASKDAPAYKERLLDARLIPRITFNWENDQRKLSFLNYEMITNEVKQQRDFAAARDSNSISAYQDFIQRYPNAPQAVQAQKSISEIQARQEKERQERLAREKAQERARQAAEAAEAAASRERARLGCGNFYPGKTGKISGKSFWFDTRDSYIVRYVNKDRQMVTIQGTNTRAGGALEEGQHHELSCTELINSTIW